MNDHVHNFAETAGVWPVVTVGVVLGLALIATGYALQRIDKRICAFANVTDQED